MSIGEAENHIDLLADLPPFDHFDAAAYLMANYPDVEPADKLPGVSAALDRLEKLFRDLNAMLTYLPRRQRRANAGAQMLSSDRC